MDPHQFLGIEVNPWAAAVAELVLWIGYLQWHFRTHGTASPAEPVLRDFKNIENRDAVLTWASRKPRMDEAGKPATRWDGETMTRHPVTGEDVPDPEARLQVYDYLSPKPATWPEADFIIGNPPFIGKGSAMREALGDGYTEALWAAYPRMPQSADFVMFWWEKAALATRGYQAAIDKTKAKGARRFGFITTNSLRQTFNRRVIEAHLADEKAPLSLVYAIPDHPWVDAGDGAAVRIAMTVAAAGKEPGRLLTITEEKKGEYEGEGRPVTFQIEKGKVFADLRIGADVAGVKPLRATFGLSSCGMMLAGQGFVTSKAQLLSLGLSQREGLREFVGPYIKGGELNALPLGKWILDFYGLTENEVKQRFPEAYQYLYDTVWPERSQNSDKGFREKWWIFGRPRTELRPALKNLSRFIATTETSKHRMFTFLPEGTRPDHAIMVIALDDAAALSVLSSRFHVTWALAAGGRLGYGNDPRYNKSKCFDPFPFPIPTEARTTRLRSLGEELDAHRKAQQAAHPKLTLTGMYNILEKLRAGERIEGKDRETYDQGLIGILRDIHDRIDAEVAAAYGWPTDLPEVGILQRLVDLNKERAAEEAHGIVRWLRPDYQNPAGRAVAARAETVDMDLGPAGSKAKAHWPKTLPEQITAVRAALLEMGEASPEEIARRFQRLRQTSVQPLLESLALLGQARPIEGGRFVI